MKPKIKRKGKLIADGYTDDIFSTISNGLVSNTSAEAIRNGLIQLLQYEKKTPWLDLIKRSKIYILKWSCFKYH